MLIFELNYPFLRMYKLLGPPFTVAPPKQEKKFLKKIMPLILMIIIIKITIKEK